jgi:hypothetical protein
MTEAEMIANAITYVLVSPNVADRNGESANLVDVIDKLQHATRMVAGAITPLGIGIGEDAAGGHVESLTEAVMGVTAGLCKIADAIENFTEIYDAQI